MAAQPDDAGANAGMGGLAHRLSFAAQAACSRAPRLLAPAPACLEKVAYGISRAIVWLAAKGLTR